MREFSRFFKNYLNFLQKQVCIMRGLHFSFCALLHMGFLFFLCGFVVENMRICVFYLVK